ncbi:MAG: hypothetical protein B7Y39_15735 [Bdellovibrio sp. 28-41-41]|nr:MAG: hypothetical protein B7Y39_15735 [Bdellovibrio sp. 28-41-41]
MKKISLYSFVAPVLFAISSFAASSDELQIRTIDGQTVRISRAAALSALNTQQANQQIVNYKVTIGKEGVAALTNLSTVVAGEKYRLIPRHEGETLCKLAGFSTSIGTTASAPFFGYEPRASVDYNGKVSIQSVWGYLNTVYCR